MVQLVVLAMTKKLPLTKRRRSQIPHSRMREEGRLDAHPIHLSEFFLEVGVWYA
jgi:hypothetical protein